jgi:capsid protein
MFDWLKQAFAAARPRRSVQAASAPLRIRSRYDAAVTTEENRRHWASADQLSANAANSPVVRRTLRSRSRYEVANNSYARGIVLTLANDCVGTGPRLQMLTDDAPANRTVEKEFGHWAEAVGLAEKLRTMRMARAQDGAVFGMLVANPKVDAPVTLDLRLVEAEQVTTPNSGIGALSGAVDGIIFDTWGNPTEYHVLRYHPGDGRGVSTADFDRIPASSVIHYLRTDRPGCVVWRV